MPDLFPPLAPTVSGIRVSMDWFLQNPARVEHVIADLAAQRFIADRILTPGPTATGGAVIYDQVLANELYMGRDVQSIEPGMEFPVLNQLEAAPLVARVTKWGGAARYSYEQIRRDRRDVLARGFTQLSNTIVKKVDGNAIAALRAAPILTGAAAGSWAATPGSIVKDIQTGMTAVDKLDMGYRITDALITPTTHLKMITNATLLSLLPREGVRPTVPNPIASGELQNVLGLTWYPTNRVTDDEVILVSGRVAGSISDEIPFYSRVIDEPDRESRLVQAARPVSIYITDPKSCYRITGVT